jgi:sugar O-acyltransferase (sialic acid O-acetyltransferase NeuD family)
MKKELIIYGAGGLGREILTMIRALPEWQPIGFIDDKVPPGTSVKGLKVLGGVSVMQAMTSTVNVVLAVGSPLVKQRLEEQLLKYSVYFPTLIHPSVIMQDSASITIGAGSIVTAGCILTTDIYIGKHVLINLNTTIGHDCSVEDYSSIMCGVNIAGEVTIARSAFIGSGANILNQASLGESCTVGMGAVVLKDVLQHTTVAGVPAKEI